jgi:hypothetical protein
MFLTKEQVRASLDDTVKDFETVKTAFESTPKNSAFMLDMNHKNVYAVYYGEDKVTLVFKLKYDSLTQDEDASLERELDTLKAKDKKHKKMFLKNSYGFFRSLALAGIFGIFVVLMGLIYFI